MENLRDVYTRACTLTKEGNYEAALEAFVWLHDNPMPDVPASEMFRRACGFQAWALLGTIYAPARRKMEELLAVKMESAEQEPPSQAIQADINVMKGILESEMYSSSK